MLLLSALLLLLSTATLANKHELHGHHDHHEHDEMPDHHDHHDHHGEKLDHHEEELDPSCMMVEEKITTCKMEPMDMDIWKVGRWQCLCDVRDDCDDCRLD